MVQALAARGCADVALDVMRARAAAGSRRRSCRAAGPDEAGDDSLGKAAGADELCNLVTEAFMEVAIPTKLPKFLGIATIS